MIPANGGVCGVAFEEAEIVKNREAIKSDKTLIIKRNEFHEWKDILK